MKKDYFVVLVSEMERDFMGLRSLSVVKEELNDDVYKDSGMFSIFLFISVFNSIVSVSMQVDFSYKIIFLDLLG